MSVYDIVSSVLSVNVAQIREIPRHGRMVPTGIWKFPVEGRVAVRGVNVDGDEQADRAVHGGPHKAVYAYAREDIDWWQEELAKELPNGVFEENLTVRGLDLGAALIGERWRVGSAVLEVSSRAFRAGSSACASTTPRCSSASRPPGVGDLPAHCGGGAASGR